MRTWRLLIRKQDSWIFERIRSGEKTIETRALNGATSRKAYYGDIKQGDTVEFVCNGECLSRRIGLVRKYRDFEKYLVSEDLGNILGPGTDIDKARKIHYSFPGYEDRLQKYGIVAFELINE